MSKDIDIAKIDEILNSQSTSSKTEDDKKTQDTEGNGIDVSKIDAIFNANKVEDNATAEQKERLETSFALGGLNRSFMNKQMAEMRRSIPDTTEQEAYDYLTTDAEDGSTDAIRGTALADRIKSGYAITKGDAEDREFIQTKYTLADELVATLPLADPTNSTDVMVGANRMPRGQAERVMAQVVESTMHPDLLKSNEAYRNNFFMENYGTTTEKYLIDLDKKLAKLQASLDKEIKRDMDAMPSLMRGGVAGGVDPRSVQSFVQSESYGGNTIRNAREKIQSILNNNFASGVDEGFDALSALSLGINDIMSGVSINNILNKSAAGKPLTKRESIALEAYDISEELEGLQNIIAPPSWSNKVGQGLGTTAEMAVQFIPMMSIAGSVGKLATLPIRASAKLTRRAFNKGVVNGVTTGMKRAASLAGKSLHNVGVSTLSGLVVAPLMPSTWSTFVDNRNNRFEIKDGKVVAHDKSVWKDLANAWIESAGEIGSERIGIRMDELIKGSASSLGRALAIDNLSSKAGKILFGRKTPAYIKSLQQKAGFTGYLSEPLSEVWGDAVVNLMKMGLTGDDNFAEMGNADYWTTTLATCALYGTGLKMATEGLPMTKRIADIERMARYRKNALNGIESESLYNTMVSILAEEDIETAAKRLSEVEWNKYHRIDIGHAMDAIRAHYAQSVALSSETETARLNSFMGQIGDIANITYRGKEGNENTNEVVTITDKNGIKYMAISGDSTTPFYVCLDANLERRNILSSDVVDVSRTTLEERMATAYSEQFSTEIEMERQQQLIDRYNEVRAGVGGADAINRVRTLFGAEEHHSGDDVTLADGTQAIVEEYLPETGEYVVTKVDGTMECVPFYNILSTNAFTAEVQSLSFAQRALSTAENEIDVEEDVENNTETQQIEEANATRNGVLAVGDVVITPTGERVRIRAINEDGSYEVDYNTAERVSPEDMEIEVFEGADLKAESAEVAPTQDVLTVVDAPSISEEVRETVTEETTPVAPQIENKPIPTNEDGTINYEAIEDPKQFVDLYSHEAGGIDTAITDVKEMRDSAVAEVAKNAEQGKKITSPNEKIANRKKQETLAQKVAFYDSVLAELEQRVTPTEDAYKTTSVEDVVEAETAEDITEDATTTETKIEEAQPKEVGLVDNELSKDLRKSIYQTLNALGEALGIQIELVDAIDGVKANGQIIDNRIQIAWKDRMKAVTFVAGHEFLHRLKDIAPEQYEKFKESVKNDLGEDGFVARINRMRRNYEYTNEQRIKKGQKPLAYTDTLLEEEVIADRMGEYVENADAFNHYLESIKPQNALLRAIRDAWAYIKNLFKDAEYRAETKRIKDMLEAIDALIDAGASAIKKVQNTERLGERNAVQGKERHSIIGEVGAEALDMAEEATIRMDNLAIARQMEERGDSALDIRMATGWERGADGLWRYEIMDAEVNLYDGNEATIRKQIEVAEEEEKDFMQQSKADTKELRERTNSYLAEMRDKYGVAEGEETDAMTDEEIAHLQSLTGKEIAFEDYKERRRNELYNRRMALEAQLAYVSVKNSEAPAEIATTRLGHILQGNDAEMLFTAHPSLRDIEVQLVTDIRDGAFAAYVTKGGYKRIELNAKKTPVDMLASYILHEVQHAIQDIEGFAGGGNLSSLQSDENVTAKEAYDYYRKIVGEVEARNVSSRINMSAEERLNTLLSETEDVAREDQIFLREVVDAMVERGTLTEAQVAEAAGARYSLTEEQATAVIEAMKANAEVAPQLELTPENWVAEFGEAGKVTTPIGEVKMSEGQYQKMQQQGRNTKLGMVKPTLTNPDVIIEENSKPKDGKVAERNSSFVFVKAFTNAEGTRDYMFTSVSNRRDGIEIVMSNQEKETPRVKRLLKEGKLAYINKATLPSELTDSAQGDQLTIPSEVSYSVNKDTTSNTENQINEQKFSLITPKMDADYLDAVERGDMETAQRMVMEAAKLAGYSDNTDYQGSLAFNGAAPMANDYFETKDERKEAWDNGDYEDTMSLGDYADNAVDTHDLRWQLTDKGNYRRVEDYAKESIDNINNTLKGDSHKITIYRAVPNNVEEGAVRNGDWVTPSRKYAEFHIGLQDWEGGRIIEQEVDIDNLWWNGDDINEWGYDDGSNYGYRNTPNNRKLLDPVTYDDNGNVIPLSERFNPEKEDIRYSVMDADGNMIGDGSIHRPYSIVDFSGYPQISHSVSKSATTESVYVTYRNEETGDKAVVRFAGHNNNATRFGDQMVGWDGDSPYAKRNENELKYRLGLVDKNIKYGTHIDMRSVSNADMESGKYEEADITLAELYALPAETDISQYTGKLAKGSRELILGDVVKENRKKIAKIEYTPRYSLQSVDTTLMEHAEYVKNLCELARGVYSITSSIVVAATKEDYAKTIEEAGYNSEDSEASFAVYLKNTDTIAVNAENIKEKPIFVESITHENAHSITKNLLWGDIEAVADSFDKEEIDALRKRALEGYDGYSSPEILDELISTFIQYFSTKQSGNLRLLDGCLKGYFNVDDLVNYMESVAINTYGERFAPIIKALMPILKKNLEINKGEYERQEIGSGSATIRFDRAREATKGGQRRVGTIGGDIEGPTTDTVYDSEAQTEGVDARYSIRTTEDTIRIYMRRGHQVAKDNIRKKYKAYRDVAKSDYAEKRRVRLDKIKTLRTNSAKVDYIFGDIDENSTPYVHQAFAKIARGEVRIVWDNSPDGKKRGIASEIGTKSGEKRLYASITNGATLYFEEYVHQWWQEMNGYENNIDTQELRDALIEALSEVCNANGAISKLREIYDTEQQTLDDTLGYYDSEEERELAEETARYEQEVAEFEQNKDAKVAEFESSLSFYDELAVIDGTISEMRSKLEKILEKSRSRVADERQNIREMREAVTEVKKLIKESIDRQSIATMQRNELRSILDKIDKAHSINKVSAIAVEIENTLLEVKIRLQRRNLDKALRLRLPDGVSVSEWVDTQAKEGRMGVADARAILEDMWRGRNNLGVSVARYVDPITAKVMEILRGLIVPTLKKKIVEDVDAEERGKYFRKDEELTLNVQGAIDANNTRLDELEEKEAAQERLGVEKTPASQRYTEADAYEYTARSIYDKYLRTIALKQDIADIAQAMDGVRIDYYAIKGKEAVRDHYLDKLREEMVDARRKYAEALEELNNDLVQLMREGKDALSAFRMAQDAHKRNIINLGLDALRAKTRMIAPKAPVMKRVKSAIRGTLNSSYNTFQTTLKEIDRFAPNGEGKFYNYFMGLWQECENNLFTQHSDNCSRVASMLRSKLGLKGKNDADVISAVIEQADAKFLGTIIYSKGVDSTGELIEPEEMPMTVSTAMFIIAMWRQPMYRNSLMKHGIDQQMINAIYDLVNRENEGYIEFMNWVNESLLPDTRLIYDKVHRAMFGASMAEERNYFPARVVNFQETVDVGNDNEGALPSTITGAIINRKKNALMPDLTQNYFKVLMGHLQEMDHWSSFAPLIRDLNTLLSNTEFKNACRQYKGGVKADGKGVGDLYTIFRNVSAIAVNAYKPKSNDIENAILKAMRGWAGSNIAWRFLTAIKQLSSMPVFAFYALDGAMQKEFTKSLIYCMSHPKAVSKWAMENSPQFRKRWESKFAGLDILNSTIGAEDGIADLNRWSKTKFGRGEKTLDKGIRKVASDWGMTPNAFVDAISVVVGMHSIYNYELKKLMKRDGNTTPNDKQKHEAMRKAEVVFNTTQQSGEGAYLSTVQSDRSLVLRMVTIYQNSPFAFHRLMVSGVSEIAKQMTNAEYRNAIREEYGDKALSDARKKAYAQLMQSAAGSYLFALMGQAIANGFYSLVGDDDDEYRSYKNVLWGATATFLFGGVVGGAVIISGLQGYGFSLTKAWDDAVKSIEKLFDMELLSVEFVYEALNIVSRYNYGVDLDTFTNIATGIQGYVEGSGDVEATMKVLNAPRSQVNLVAGVRRDDETIMEYVTRRMRVESMLSVPDYYALYSAYGEFIGKGVLGNNPFRVSEYQVKKYHSEYADAYNSNVVSRFGGKEQLAQFKETNNTYTENIKAIGLRANSSPSEKTRMAILSGVEDKYTYNRLFEVQGHISEISKKMDRFVGKDENYYKIAVRLNEVKENFNRIYDELDK